jgi:hypothetical protein
MILRKNALAANARSSSEVLRGVFLFVVVLLFAGISAQAQCPTATVAVKGRLENVPEGSKGIEILVALETANGRFSHVGAISDGAFNVDVPFDTQKSPYSPLGGHHCTNLPKTVTVKVSKANQTLGERVLSFKKSFEQQDSNRYRLRQDLTIDLSRSSTGKP